MNCFYCKGKMEDTSAKFIVDLGDCVVIVKNVPAQVCCQCGEISYDHDVAQELERIVDAVRHSMVREVAIVDYRHTAA